MTVKITSLEAENVKRIKAVQITPSPTGLTVIGGRNGQGKSSVLDAIAWALGGSKLKPSQPRRIGSVQDPEIKIELSNGLVVERKGKNSDLKVTDPTGARTGQKILDQLIGEMALNVPKFMEAKSTEKASYLLQVLGVGDKLSDLEKSEKELVSARRYVGQEGKRESGYAEGLQFYPGVGETEVTASDLIMQQQEILARNGRNAALRRKKDDLKRDLDRLDREVRDAEQALEKLKAQRDQTFFDHEAACKDALDLYDESTDEVEAKLKEIDEINQKVRANREKKAAIQRVEAKKEEYRALTDQIEKVREERSSLLESAPLPLPELEVVEGEILYKGQKWDCMSGSEQLKVSTAICRAMNPECGFVLLDKLEQMDTTTLNEFGQWLESEGLQAIATRVSTGEECSLIIEDGQVKGDKENDSIRSNQNSYLGSAWSW